ncbi:MAG: toll/interleukin-1 receptor domain-containing protein, partial [Chloroflexi bacterium]|nr:toll/interleukin-1 receptor domain-containing protein [Chloroflexota bacterium]
MGQEKILDHQDKDNYENAVFVSYAWGGESERVVDELERAFEKAGVRIKRDKKEINYKDSIKAFEQRIGRGQCVVLVVSDKYLRSKHCMYELVEINKNQSFEKRVFPIVFDDALIYTMNDRLMYIKYWDDTIENLNRQIDEISKYSSLRGIFEDFDEYKLIRFHLIDLLNYLGDINTQSLEKHESEGFSTLINLIKQRMTGQQVGLQSDREPLSPDLMSVAKDGQVNDLPPPPMSWVFIKLAGDFHEYTISRLRDVQEILSNALGIVENWIQVIDVKAGSVIIKIELPKKSIPELALQILNKDPKIFNYLMVEEFRIEGMSSVTTPGEKSGASKSFVGHEVVLDEFRNMLSRPYGNKRILFMLGSGGLGKTTLVRRMLTDARITNKAICADEPIDLFSTDYRHIDGIQRKIKEIIEALPEIKDEPSPFADWIEGRTDTSDNFYDCLKTFCEKRPLVLAFDTFENLDSVASSWLFKGENDGLQVPGLICVIAGREEGRDKEELDGYRYNPLVKEIPISGFTLKEAEEFYRRIESEFPQPLSSDLLKALGMEPSDSIHMGIERVWEITEGHPLRLEMAFRLPGDLLSENSLANLEGLTAKQYEEKLMQQVREWGLQGGFTVGSLPVA